MTRNELFGIVTRTEKRGTTDFTDGTDRPAMPLPVLPVSSVLSVKSVVVWRFFPVMMPKTQNILKIRARFGPAVPLLQVGVWYAAGA